MNTSVIEEIAGAIADVENTEPDDLNIVLQNYVPTEAVQRLVDHDSASWRVQFETPNHVIEVAGNDTIRVDGEQRRDIS